MLYFDRAVEPSTCVKSRADEVRDGPVVAALARLHSHRGKAVAGPRVEGWIEVKEATQCVCVCVCVCARVVRSCHSSALCRSAAVFKHPRGCSVAAVARIAAGSSRARLPGTRRERRGGRGWSRRAARRRQSRGRCHSPTGARRSPFRCQASRRVGVWWRVGEKRGRRREIETTESTGSLRGREMDVGVLTGVRMYQYQWHRLKPTRATKGRKEERRMREREGGERPRQKRAAK